MGTSYQQVADAAAAGGADEVEREKRVQSVTDLRIHYGPVYGRAFGETMALCKPVGFMNAIMSNDMRSVDCRACRDLRLTIPASTNHGESIK